MKLRDGLGEAESKTPTPWAVYCENEYTNCINSIEGENPRLIFLTEACYNLQMALPDSTWSCPRCGQHAEWSDENFEKRMDIS